MNDILNWLRNGQSGSGIDLPGGWRLVREFDVVRASAGPTGPPLRSAADYRILVVGNAEEAPSSLDRAELGADRRTEDAGWRLLCPADALQGNLRVRNHRPGDRMQPFGLSGTKKVSDLLREQRIPAAARAETLVVEDAAGILWIVGLARAERTRMLPSPGRTVTIVIAPRHQQSKRGNEN